MITSKTSLRVRPRSIRWLTTFVGRQPVSDTYSQSTGTLHATYTCCKVRAEEPAIRRFIRQSAYRRQSQVDRRRSLRVLFECNPVPRDYRFVEGESSVLNSPMSDCSKLPTSIVQDPAASELPSGLVCVCFSPLEAASCAAAKSVILSPIL